MGKVKVTLPGLEIPVTGKQVTFTAPCDCSTVECIQIDGVDYTVVDAIGNVVTGSPTGGTWCNGSKVSVVLDVENRKAYLLNGAGTKIQAGNYKGTGTYGPSNISSLTFDFVPKLFVLLVAGSSEYMIVCPQTGAIANLAYFRPRSVGNNCVCALYGKTLQWYTQAADDDAPAIQQGNQNGYYYFWYAIG